MDKKLRKNKKDLKTSWLKSFPLSIWLFLTSIKTAIALINL